MERRFSVFVRAVIDGDVAVAAALLKTNPELALQMFDATFFYRDIAHYAYQGDTALHMAAAAFQRSTARLLVRKGAALDVRTGGAPSRSTTPPMPIGGIRRRKPGPSPTCCRRAQTSMPRMPTEPRRFTAR